MNSPRDVLPKSDDMKRSTMRGREMRQVKRFALLCACLPTLALAATTATVTPGTGICTQVQPKQARTHHRMPASQPRRPSRFRPLQLPNEQQRRGRGDIGAQRKTAHVHALQDSL